MKVMKNAVICSIALAVLQLLFSNKAHAYIDPGSSGYFLQLLIGVLLSAVFSIKLFWNKIRASIKNLFRRDRER